MRKALYWILTSTAFTVVFWTPLVVGAMMAYGY